jgi:hypothetical protein
MKFEGPKADGPSLDTTQLGLLGRRVDRRRGRRSAFCAGLGHRRFGCRAHGRATASHNDCRERRHCDDAKHDCSWRTLPRARILADDGRQRLEAAATRISARDFRTFDARPANQKPVRGGRSTRSRGGAGTTASTKFARRNEGIEARRGGACAGIVHAAAPHWIPQSLHGALSRRGDSEQSVAPTARTNAPAAGGW